MASDYTELKVEIQNWLDRSDAGLVAAIPTMIEDAEAGFNRSLRTWEMECSSTTPMVQNGVTDATRGVYALPADWAGHKTILKDGDNLRIIYYRRIPALTDAAPANWLLAKHADLYRNASLASAESWLKNDPRIALWQGARDRAIVAISALAQRDEYSNGPLRTRTPNDRFWKLIERTDGAYELISAHDFFDIVSSGRSKQQLGIQVFGYFTVSYGNIHVWPKPQTAPTGDFGWSACP